MKVDCESQGQEGSTGCQPFSCAAEFGVSAPDGESKDERMEVQGVYGGRMCCNSVANCGCLRLSLVVCGCLRLSVVVCRCLWLSGVVPLAMKIFSLTLIGLAENKRLN